MCLTYPDAEDHNAHVVLNQDHRHHVIGSLFKTTNGTILVTSHSQRACHLLPRNRQRRQIHRILILIVLELSIERDGVRRSSYRHLTAPHDGSNDRWIFDPLPEFRKG